MVGPCPAPSRIVVHFCLRAECCVRVLATHSDVSARTALQVRSLLLYSSQTIVVRSAHGLPMLVELTLHFSAAADASVHTHCKEGSTILTMKKGIQRMVRPLYIYDRRLSRQNCPAKQPHVFKSNVPFKYEMQSCSFIRNHVPIITLVEFAIIPSSLYCTLPVTTIQLPSSILQFTTLLPLS